MRTKANLDFGGEICDYFRPGRKRKEINVVSGDAEDISREKGAMRNNLVYSVFPVQLGAERTWMVGIERKERISALRFFPFQDLKGLPGWVEKRFPGAESGETGLLRALREEMGVYLRGEPVRLDFPLDLSAGTSFQQRVYRQTRAIPWGGVDTYGGVARKLGLPGAARAVGNALRANRHLILVPCHRVIRAGGGWGGFSAPGGVKVKKNLIGLEKGAGAGESGPPGLEPWSRSRDQSDSKMS